MARSHPARSREGIRWFIPACFFLSGASGLVYEVLWTRMLVEVIGGAPYSVSIILTVFMGGLGAGSFWAGRLVDRVPPARLVSIYGTLELVIAGSAGLIPWVLTAVRPLQAFLYDRLYDYALAYHVLTFGVCALVLCLPVLCMGATLPILCRYGVHELAHLGRRTGRLYGLNTLGAAVGTLVCGFYLIERWGMDGALWAAVAVNAAIGLACILLGSRQSRSAATRPRCGSTGPGDAPRARRRRPSQARRTRDLRRLRILRNELRGALDQAPGADRGADHLFVHDRAGDLHRRAGAGEPPVRRVGGPGARPPRAARLHPGGRRHPAAGRQPCPREHAAVLRQADLHLQGPVRAPERAESRGPLRLHDSPDPLLRRQLPAGRQDLLAFGGAGRPLDRLRVHGQHGRLAAGALPGRVRVPAAARQGGEPAPHRRPAAGDLHRRGGPAARAQPLPRGRCSPPGRPP